MSTPAPRTITRAELVAAGVRTVPGETVPELDDRAPALSHLGAREPSIGEAAHLLGDLLAAGAVARLDLLHDALANAYRRGRAAERVEVQRLAHEHAGALIAALVARGDL